MTFRSQGLILYKESKEKRLNEIFLEVCEIFEDKLKDKKYFYLFQTGLKDGWILLKIPNKFTDYVYFDNFLITLGKKFYNDEDIIVLGHSDKEGFFWSDYSNQQPYYNKDRKEVENNGNNKRRSNGI